MNIIEPTRGLAALISLQAVALIINSFGAGLRLRRAVSLFPKLVNIRDIEN